jgi:hypothetical protein
MIWHTNTFGVKWIIWVRHYSIVSLKERLLFSFIWISHKQNSSFMISVILDTNLIKNVLLPWQNGKYKFATNLLLSASAASGPGIVIAILDGEATLYFLTNGLHILILTNISKIVFAKTLITGDIGGGKKLKNEILIKIQMKFS